VADTSNAPADTAVEKPFDIEQPACFYLGREWDLAEKKVLPDKYVMYNARDLTTHGVIVGMTGSGKTGMAISLLEEVAIDAIPSIIIDPKGDLTNLLLQFPDLDPAQFEHWLNEDDAQQKGISKRQLAEQLSQRWRQGLEETGQPVARIHRLRGSSEWRIYTPGSEAGLPLSILGNFAPPKDSENELEEDRVRRIDALTTALLGLTGLFADPIQSREHVLVSNILADAWKKGQEIDLATLIQRIQNPPMKALGTYSLETFYPARERIKFASTLNNVLASHGFKTWTTGEPLALSRMLYRNGKPQQVIFYVAHLDDVQRMFFITLLLEEVLSWTRKQSGTTNLRALLYFDEVFGYLPPHPLNPPSKGPLLTLLKQARAFGVGVLLATQNPVDLDYKALSNAGTWFIGKLQTERDKARLLEGLESVARERGTLTDRGYLEKVIASLGHRVFLLHSIHAGQPRLFQSRWAMSFLRGPLTRSQVQELMAPYKEPQKKKASAAVAIPLCTHCHAEVPDGTDVCPSCGKSPWARMLSRVQDQAFREQLMRGGAPPMAVPLSAGAAGNDLPQAIPVAREAIVAQPPPGPAESVAQHDASNQQPVLPPDVTQFYVPVSGARPAGAVLEYHAHVLGFAELTFLLDKRTGQEYTQSVRLLATPAAPGHPLAWSDAQAAGDKLDPNPKGNATWGAVPDSVDTGRKLKSLEKGFVEYLYSTQKLSLMENRTLQLISAPGESEASFRKRCREAAEQQARAALDLERAKFQPKFDALGLDMPDDVPKKGGFLSFFGIGGSSSKSRSSSSSQRGEEKQRKLEADYESKKAEIKKKWERSGDEFTPLQIKPRKADIRMTHFGLAWLPFWRTGQGKKSELVPAYRTG
jgi:hypothetical protein